MISNCQFGLKSLILWQFLSFHYFHRVFRFSHLYTPRILCRPDNGVGIACGKCRSVEILTVMEKCWFVKTLNYIEKKEVESRDYIEQNQ